MDDYLPIASTEIMANRSTVTEIKTIAYWRLNKIPAAIALILSLHLPAFSAEEIELATDEWVPYTSANLEGYGEFTKRVTLILNQMEMKPNYLFYPWRRCFDSVAKGKIWAAFPYSYTEERAEKVWFSDVLSCSKSVFFYYDNGESSARYQFTSLEDLKPYTIGGVTGYFYEESFKKAGIKIDYVSREIYGMEKLKLGRIDLMPINEQVGWNLIKTHFPDDVQKFKTIATPFTVNSLRLIVSPMYPDSQKLLNAFNKALALSIKKGLIEVETCK